MALAAIVVAALVATGVGVFLVTRGDDSSADPTTTTAGVDPGSTAPDPSGSSPSTAPTSEDPGSTTSTAPGDPGSTTPLPDLPFPGGLGDPLPDGFPTPEGAQPGAIGLEVDQPASAVIDFYRSALPAAGYTVADGDDASTGASLLVTGNGVDGQLVITDIVTPTRIVWLAG